MLFLKQDYNFIGNKIADKIVEPKLAPDINSRNVEEIDISSEKIEAILNKLRQAF